jgi:hypothetical protein
LGDAGRGGEKGREEKRRKGRREGRREGGLAEERGRLSLNFPSDGQDDTSLGGKGVGGGLQGKEGHMMQGWRDGWGGRSWAPCPARTGRRPTLMLIQKWA